MRLGLRQLGWETGLSILNSQCFQAKYAFCYGIENVANLGFYTKK